MLRRKLVFAVAALLLASCSSTPWKMVSQRDIPSPDGKHVATVFEMSCECTTGFFPQLSLRRPTEKIGKYGNVLNGAPAETINARWISSNHLVVKIEKFEHSASPESGFTNIDGITVEFQKAIAIGINSPD
jgi:hypothetical protein